MKHETLPQPGTARGAIAADQMEARRSLTLPSQFVYVPIKVLDPPEPLRKRKTAKK